MSIINFNAYTAREIQHFISILSQCESAGVTDIRFIREQLQNKIHNELRDHRTINIAYKRATHKRCPSCKSAWLIPVVSDGSGIEILGCKKCRYSEVIR